MNGIKDGLVTANRKTTLPDTPNVQLLKDILKAEADIAKLEIKASDLRKQYCEEIREFADGEIVDVLMGYVTPTWVAAKVTRAEFQVDPFDGSNRTGKNDWNGRKTY